MSIAKRFEELKQELREKWIDYCNQNEEWLHTFLDSNGGWESTSGEIEKELREHLGDEWYVKRPISFLIIGVASTLVPEIKEYIEILLLGTSGRGAIIKALGLDFDPFLEIERRKFFSQQKATLLPSTTQRNTPPE